MPDQTERAWRKSRHCGASNTCVEVAEWCTASARCGANTGCVEVGAAPTAVAVRDSTDPAGPMLVLTPAAWGALLGSIKETRRA